MYRPWSSKYKLCTLQITILPVYVMYPYTWRCATVLPNIKRLAITWWLLTIPLASYSEMFFSSLNCLALSPETSQYDCSITNECVLSLLISPFICQGLTLAKTVNHEKRRHSAIKKKKNTTQKWEKGAADNYFRTAAVTWHADRCPYGTTSRKWLFIRLVGLMGISLAIFNSLYSDLSLTFRGGGCFLCLYFYCIHQVGNLQSC